MGHKRIVNFYQFLGELAVESVYVAGSGGKKQFGGAEKRMPESQQIRAFSSPRVHWNVGKTKKQTANIPEVLLDFYQFNMEVQFLSCHFVVGIKGNGGIITGGHLDLHRLAGRGIQDYALTDIQILTAG